MNVPVNLLTMESAVNSINVHVQIVLMTLSAKLLKENLYASAHLG